MKYLFSGQKRPRGYLIQELVAVAVAFGVVGPLTYWVTERTPPQVRLHGTFDPPAVVQGGVGRVLYVTSKRLRSDCEGTVQQEIIDSRNTIYSKLAKAVGPAQFIANPNNPEHEDLLIGNPVEIPEQASPGPATFRTVSFRYCNWLQKVLHWPITQIGPDIKFTITAKE